MSNCIELLHIALELPASKPINIISVYHPPSSSFIDFIDCFHNFLSNIDYTNLPLIILGDFNINMANIKSSQSHQFKTLLKDFGLNYYGNTPTRNTFTSNTHIDLLIYNTLSYSYINGFKTLTCGFSDHDMIIFGYKKPKLKKTLPKIIYHTSFSDAILNQIHLELENINMVMISLNNDNDINGTLDKYMSILNDIFSKLPTKCIKISSTQHPWISSDFIKLTRKRDKMFILAKQSSCQHIMTIAKKLKNACTKLSRSLKGQYIRKQLLNNNHNPKKT